MKVLVCGAGIQGSYLAFSLSSAGVDATLLARGQRLKDLQENGVRLAFHPSDEVVSVQVPVISSIDLEAGYDTFIIAMQKQQAISFSPALSNFAENAAFVYLGNNGTGVSDYEKHIPSQNIVLGFLGVGGLRMDGFMRVIAPEPVTIYLGTMMKDSPRLHQVSSLLKSAGLKVDLVSDIDAWLKCHLAMILPITGAIYGAGADNYRLARTPGLIRLMLRGLKESFRVHRKLGYPITPRKLRILTAFPEWLAVRVYKKRLATKEAEIALAGHAGAARDEMQHLYEEFKILVDRSGVSTSCLDFLMRFLDPNTQLIDEGVESIRISS